jgi:N-acetylmuramic acid 6-phosphate etherase
VIAGSTRLKAGTATKLVLNMLTTGAMVRIGKTYGNLMVDVQTGSEKLKDRARRIVNIVTGLEYEEADKLLKVAQWNVKAAIVMQKTGLSYAKAIARLRKAHDSMREALNEDIEPRLRGLLQGHAEGTAVTTGQNSLSGTIPTPPTAPRVQRRDAAGRSK